MGWFGPSKEEVWRELSEKVGGRFVDGGLWKSDKVQLEAGPWTLTLDTHTQSQGEGNATYTRMRAPFVNPEGFRFTIYRKSLFTALGKWLGMQDIEVGDLEFDDAFVIKANDETRVRELLASDELRRRIQAQPRIRLEIRDGEGWLGPKFPAEVDELHFEVIGVIKDVERLRDLFDLFVATLDRLAGMRVARKEHPGVQL